MKKIATKEERAEFEYINLQTMYRHELITELREACHFSIKELSTYLDICDKTLRRYMNYERKLPMDIYFKACYILSHFMKEHDISVTPRIKELIELTSLFNHFFIQ